MQKSEWASWVQAVGSILAILGAAGIAWWQYLKVKRAEAERARVVDRAKLMALAHILVRAQAAIEIARHHIASEDLKHFYLAVDEMGSVRALIDRVPLFEIPIPGLMGKLQDANRYMVRCAVLGRALYEAPTAEGNAIILKAIEASAAQLKAARDICVSHIAKLTCPGDPPVTMEAPDDAKPVERDR